MDAHPDGTPDPHELAGADEAYARLPGVGPYPARIGSALITMVEPHPGHERAYNRWYEDDHFYSGATAMPWLFAGKRWVATRELQLLRYPADSIIARPVTAGCYIATYWITEGRYEDHLRWTVASNQRLLPDGRIYLDRTHVFTSFQRYRGATTPHEGPPWDHQSLDHPSQGLVLEVIDAAPDSNREELVAWLHGEDLPTLQAKGSILFSHVFQPMPLPEDKMAYVEDIPGIEGRVTVLHVLGVRPQDCWAELFAGRGDAIAATGRARVELCAPFLPTIPGTDTYVDELR
jgi:hypothetical protein